MMQIYFGLYLILFASVSLAAPTEKRSKENASAPEASHVNEVENEESALEKLVSASGDVNKPHSKTFVHSDFSSFSNINGDQETSAEEHQKVVEDGKLVKDLKQHVTQIAVEKNVPHKIVRTDVEIPSQGIHKTLTSVDGEPMETALEDKEEDSVQLSPTDVARYLLETDAIEEFESVLNASSMSKAEADEYREAVKSEYSRLLEQYLAERIYGDDEFSDLDEFNQNSFDDTFENPESEAISPYTDDSMMDNLPLLDDERDYLFNKIPYLTKDAEEQYSTYTAEAELDTLIRNVIENWLIKAIATGDREDETLVANIARLVANDDDPNDEEQVKEGLEDLVAQSILDELSGLDYNPSYDSEQSDDQLPLINEEQSRDESEEKSSETEETNGSKNEGGQKSESEGKLENDLKAPSSITEGFRYKQDVKAENVHYGNYGLVMFDINARRWILPEGMLKTKLYECGRGVKFKRGLVGE